MLKLYDGGAYLVNGTEIITDEAEVKAKTGREVSKEEAICIDELSQLTLRGRRND